MLELGRDCCQFEASLCAGRESKRAAIGPVHQECKQQWILEVRPMALDRAVVLVQPKVRRQAGDEGGLAMRCRMPCR